MEERGAPPPTGHLAPARARLLPWALASFGLFLLATVVGAVVIGVLDAGRLGVGQGVFAAGFLMPFLFPGWLLHLLVLAFLPADWPRSRGRMVSIVASPLWLVIPLFTEGLIWSPMHAVALGYGLVTRLRQPKGV